MPSQPGISRFFRKTNKPVFAGPAPDKLDQSLKRLQEPANPPSKKAKTTSTSSKSKSTKSKTLTPLESQFLALKAAHRDKILAVQVGYKYKFFGEDAVIAAHILNIMLLPGLIAFDELENGNFAYCSIPDNRLHVHLQRLLAHGHKVGVVKQVETAAVKSVLSSKLTVFERKVTAVYTKATYMGDELADGAGIGDENAGPGDYIMCLVEDDDQKTVSVVAVQPASGDVVVDRFEDGPTREALDARLAVLSPSEVVLLSLSLYTLRCVRASGARVDQKKPVSRADLDQVLRDRVSLACKPDQNPTAVLSFYHDFPPGIQTAVCHLLQYLHEFGLASLFSLVDNVRWFATAGKHMHLPGPTVHALELFRSATDPAQDRGTLVWLLDHTRTKMGRRLLRQWIARPLARVEDITARLDAIEDIADGFNHIVDALKNQLTKLANIDLERLLIKIHYAATTALDRISRKEIYLMLKSFNDITKMCTDFGAGAVSDIKATKKSTLLKSVFESLLELSLLEQLKAYLGMINPQGALDNSKTQFFNLNDNYLCDEVVEQNNQIARVEAELDAELANIRKFLNRPNLTYVSVLKETHMVEVRNGKQSDELPSDWLKISGTKTVSRFRPPAVSKLHKQLHYHNELLEKACDDAYHNFLVLLDDKYSFFKAVVLQLACFDCLLSLTAASFVKHNYVRPTFTLLQMVDIKSSRNPIIENLSHGLSGYVSNDVAMSHDKDRVHIITGPNMGGKSSYVKQVALLVIMAHIGCFLPCTSAKLGTFDSVYIRMGASDNILKGNSTFMVEMMETANIVASFSQKSLIILDEIGRGTGTNDGIAIAYSILRYLVEDERRPLTLFITHYPSLSVLERQFPKIVANFHMGFLEKELDEKWPEIVFLYTLIRGVVSNSYGLNVARLAGIPDSVISTAFEVSENMKKDIEDRHCLATAAKFTRLVKLIQKGKPNLEELKILD